MISINVYLVTYVLFEYLCITLISYLIYTLIDTLISYPLIVTYLPLELPYYRILIFSYHELPLLYYYHTSYLTI